MWKYLWKELLDKLAEKFPTLRCFKLTAQFAQFFHEMTKGPSEEKKVIENINSLVDNPKQGSIQESEVPPKILDSDGDDENVTKMRLQQTVPEKVAIIKRVKEEVKRKGWKLDIKAGFPDSCFSD